MDNKLIKCIDCEYFDTKWTYVGSDVHYCTKHKLPFRETDFCSYGRNKESINNIFNPDITINV